MREYMKLQKRLSRKYKGKEYFKWMIVLPEEEVMFAGLKEGDELKVDAEKGKIHLVKRNLGTDE
jgi:formylmethanofuran dehydrogenase subunit D